MIKENGIGMNHHVHSRGYMRNIASVPGQYERKAARHVSSKRPAIKILFFIPKQIQVTGNSPDVPEVDRK